MPTQPRPRPLLGAHVSTAGGLHNAIDRAAGVRAECFQIFTRAPGMWKARPWREGEVARFREMRAAAGDPPLLVHDIYLTNLAAPAGELRERSIATVAEERQRCAEIGADGLVCHLGAHLGEGVERGIARYAEALREILDRTAGNPVPILLENSAGQGTCLGHTLTHIGEVIEQAGAPGDLGLCLDTCHLFAGGYDLRDESAYEALWTELDQRIGRDRLRAFHLNDSKKGLGCRVDRHEHIGQGEIGPEAFARLLRDPRVAGLPMVIETPEVDEMHATNLSLLRSLERKRGQRRA
ncbi:MAG: deoxyribonuclease IV [Proteobacteria bacterium]|nr:deoxyribonuclease IV [Pseudomonadota bacterium]